jgi:hypothetical protein
MKNFSILISLFFCSRSSKELAKFLYASFCFFKILVWQFFFIKKGFVGVSEKFFSVRCVDFSEGIISRSKHRDWNFMFSKLDFLLSFLNEELKNFILFPLLPSCVWELKIV